MKEKFFYGALAVLSLTACSQEEVLDVNRNGDEITFSVVTNKATRATALYDNSTLPLTMKVWGNMSGDGTAYFAGDVVSIEKSGTTVTCTSTNDRYWPAVALDFFAVAGRSDNSLTVSRASGATATSASFEYTVNSTVADQEDVLYAAALNKSKPAANSAEKVKLNFAHALSQIVFKAKNSNPKLHVVVSGVKVAHLNDKGTFKFNSDTGTVFDEQQDGTTGKEYSANNNNPAGSWIIDTTTPGNATYTIDCSSDVTLSTTVQDLAGAKTEMLLMPQTQNAWYKPATGSASGTFFALKCRIYNVAGNTYDKDHDVQLWGAKDQNKNYNGEEEYVLIPAGIEWAPGKKYIYTFNFANGNGGFEPEPGTGEPDPTKPVLIPIEYTVTVDDFDIVEDKTVLVNGENKQN